MALPLTVPAGAAGAFDRDRLAAFAARRCGLDAGGAAAGVREVQIDVRLLRGGLEASVACVAAKISDATGRSHACTFVAKRLDGDQQREAAVYQDLLEPLALGTSPRLLGVEAVAPTTSYLYLEYVRPSSAWPWKEAALAGLVLERLAAVHTALPAAGQPPGGPLGTWDSETELNRSAVATLEVYEQVVAHEALASLRAGRGAIRRMVASLPAVRTALLAAAPFGVAVLHGDVHSGNAVVRIRDGTQHVVLLDWARARLGSPLEDVSSWLQSLGYWEPEARRRHDTLLRRYLAARGLPTHLGRELRDAYWLAGACNVLAGALRYHLLVADGWGAAPSRTRADAARAARDHLRIIRRADALWRR